MYFSIVLGKEIIRELSASIGIEKLLGIEQSRAKLGDDGTGLIIMTTICLVVAVGLLESYLSGIGEGILL